MARPVPFLRDGILTDQHHGVTVTIAVGTPAWKRWLRDATTFVVEHQQGTFTARKERAGNRRGGWYWRAYHTRDGLRQRAYLGKAEDLTLARLHDIAALLAARGHPDDHSDPAASAPRTAHRAPASAGPIRRATRRVWRADAGRLLLAPLSPGVAGDETVAAAGAPLRGRALSSP